MEIKLFPLKENQPFHECPFPLSQYLLGVGRSGFITASKSKKWEYIAPGAIGLVVGIAERLEGFNPSPRVGERRDLGRKKLVCEEEDDEDGVGENETRFWCCLRDGQK